MIIGRGTNANINNHTTISLDKSVLRGLERNRPANGYPEAQERAIAEMRKRVEDYEAEHGELE
jgi:hypothetical protein